MKWLLTLRQVDTNRPDVILKPEWRAELLGNRDVLEARLKGAFGHMRYRKQDREDPRIIQYELEKWTKTSSLIIRTEITAKVINTSRRAKHLSKSQTVPPITADA